jgi:hypothetical protein
MNIINIPVLLKTENANDVKNGNMTDVKRLTMSLELQPVTFKEACCFITKHHRHHKPPQGWKFGIAVNDGNKIVGVATVGRPVARFLDDTWTLEVTRLCTDGTKNACSKLYSACWRATKAMGYKRLITYILSDEKGTTLKASGWKELYKTSGGSWSSEKRKRIDKHPTGEKTLFEIKELQDEKTTK